MTAGDKRIHKHVSVFQGPDKRYIPGLVLIPCSGGSWEVLDETGQIGQADAVYGTWPSERVACREALRLLRAHFGRGIIPVWGAGSPNEVLIDLGYKRGRVRWRWWPPGLIVVGGESPIGTDGMPANPDTISSTK